MYTQLKNGFSGVNLQDKHFIFHRVNGNPFLVTNDLFQRLLSDTVQEQDQLMLQDAGYLNTTTPPIAIYQDRINTHIENYSGPFVLDLTISEGCNLGCHMCIHAFSVIDGTPRSSKKVMTFETAQKWIDYYIDVWAQKVNLPYLSFHFGAAEPFLNKKALLQCLDYIEQKLTPLDKEILINSNLTLLDDEILQSLAKHKVRVSVGLDGLEKDNDLIRIDSKQRGTFAIIVKNISRLLDAGVAVGVNLTLTDRNIKTVEPGEFLREMKKLGLDAVLVDIDFVLGVKFDWQTIVAKLMQFYVEAESIGIELRGNWLAPFYNLTSEDELEPRSFCASLRGKNIVVTPSGNLSYCTYSSDVVSTPQSPDVDNAMLGFVDDMKQYMKNYYLTPSGEYCGSCDLLGFCGGGCRITHEQNGATELMCQIYRGATEALIKHNYQEEIFD